MNKNIILFLLVLFLVGCSPSAATETAAPSPTQVPYIDTQAPEPTTEPVEEPVTFDFGGKAVYTQLHFDDLESGNLQPGFIFGAYSDSIVTDDSSQVVDGNYSIRLSQYGHITTNPYKLKIESNTTYLIQFDYKILHRGDENKLLIGVFYPVDADPLDTAQWISSFDLLGNADDEGSFSFGALTGDAPGYIFRLSTTETSSVVIDNIQVIRQDPRWTGLQPEYWGNLESLPFPRLGNYALGSIGGMVYGMVGEAFYYSANLIESRLAMFDILVGFEVTNQTMDPGLTFRLRSMNPDILILPYTITHEHGIRDPLFDNATIDLYQTFQTGLAKEWIVKDSFGNDIYDHDQEDTIYQLNTSEFCPLVGGQTFQQYQVNWVVNTILKSGTWDGIFFDNLFARVNPHIPNRWNPALFDFDYNANGIKDENPAIISEMTRRSTIRLLEQMRIEIGDSQIIMGNTWAFPEIYVAQYVNGYIFECVDDGWDNDWTPGYSEPAWRLILEEYFYMQAHTLSPTINILEGCGNHFEMEPTKDDLRNHRLTLGTTLLSDGFYVYDLNSNISGPYWFDEYTVNEDGVAEEAPENKGYLGLALGEAIELTSPAVTVWEEDFENGTMPDELRSALGVYVSLDPGEVISGSGSLVIDNPDHTRWQIYSISTNPYLVPFIPGETYIVEFDWRVIESLDIEFWSFIWNGTVEVPHYFIPGVVVGDSGTAYFPMTLGPGGNFRLTFQVFGGGGKVAIDNIRVTQGGAGPWRRDFENGFVLVNPLNKPYTFTLDELIGIFGRTGIKRILGTQAPEVNNGQLVIDSLTLQPFDAIILLADPIPLE